MTRVRSSSAIIGVMTSSGPQCGVSAISIEVPAVLCVLTKTNLRLKETIKMQYLDDQSAVPESHSPGAVVRVQLDQVPSLELRGLPTSPSASPRRVQRIRVCSIFRPFSHASCCR